MMIGLIPVCSSRIIEIKLKDDSGIRLMDAGLAESGGDIVFPDAPGVLWEGTRIRRVFMRTDAELAADRHSAFVRTGRPMPDLAQYFHIEVPDSRMISLLEHCRRHALVEHAVVLPQQCVPAAVRDSTPDFTSYQEYLFEESGPAVSRAWDYPGGRGEGITVAVLDAHCNRHHEDLAHRLGDDGVVIGGLPGGLPGAIDHGTAVAGLLIAGNNGFGITGICHQASMRLYFVDAAEHLANAIDLTQAVLAAGDLILIELQVPGPNHSGGDDQFGMVPAEYIPSVFDAISLAVAQGRIVIEPAGNGSQNLDDAIYGGVFDPAQRDSGAVLVGAGRPVDRAPVSYTNFGTRVNVQGWSERMNPCCQVWSTGYGDAPNSPSESDRLYTNRFSGTSSAAAMVAGIAACLQGAARFRAAELLEAEELRRILIDTGTPQSGSHHIGPLPDVGAAIDSIPIAQVVTDLDLNLQQFTGNDPFLLTSSTINPLETKAVVKYVALQCIDDWFFMDCDTGSFLPFVEGCPEILNPGISQQTLLVFTWPEGDFGSVFPGNGFAFYMAYTDLFEGDLVSNLDSAEFGWY